MPYNVVNGAGVKDQMLSMAKVETRSSKGTVNAKRPGGNIKGDVDEHGYLSPGVNRAPGNKNIASDNRIQSHHPICGGPMSYLYHSYNLIDGKQVILKSAFKSKDAYIKANKQVSDYLRKKLKNGTNLDKNGRDTYSGKMALEKVDAFYWTKKGLYVVYNTGTIAAVAAQQQIVHVSNKYGKYY